ncbi:MAG: TraL conjugative transposon family protein [Tannerella sp.]|jgi:hypothetical protein|nr:TraL conjugative transposon family protein [Tannerella sp.]
MKGTITKIGEFLTESRSEMEFGLRKLCGKSSPLKRFIAVISVCGILAVVNIYFVADSLYSMGKRDAEKQFLKLQHIRQPEMPHRQDSVVSIDN